MKNEELRFAPNKEFLLNIPLRFFILNPSFFI